MEYFIMGFITGLVCGSALVGTIALWKIEAVERQADPEYLCSLEVIRALRKHRTEKEIENGPS
jgi:hypothetical protein